MLRGCGTAAISTCQSFDRSLNETLMAAQASYDEARVRGHQLPVMALNPLALG